MSTFSFTPTNNNPGTLNQTAAFAALKELYYGQHMVNLTYQDNTLLAMLPKMTNAQGKNIPFPVISAPPQGRSRSFSAALANPSALTAESFFLQRTSNYELVGIDTETYMSSASDMGSFLKAAQLSIDPGVEYLARNTNSTLFRDGSGVIGQIGTIATGVITLTNPDDSVQFEQGQLLVAAATTTGTAFNGGSGVETGAATFNGGSGPYCGIVLSVDRSLGTVTVSGTNTTAASPTSWVAGSFIRTLGDTTQSAPGLAAWIPTIAPGSGDSFFGVNRSVDPTRLSGVRYNGSTQTIDEAVIQGLALANREGAKPETLITNFTTYAALQKSLQSRSVYIGKADHKVGDISFEGFRFMSSGGPVTVYMDRDCQAKTVYALTMDTWELLSLGTVPHVFMADGNSMLRSPTQDALLIRINAYYVLGCHAPGRNAVFQVSE